MAIPFTGENRKKRETIRGSHEWPVRTGKRPSNRSFVFPGFAPNPHTNRGSPATFFIQTKLGKGLVLIFFSCPEPLKFKTEATACMNINKLFKKNVYFELFYVRPLPGVEASVGSINLVFIKKN